MAFPIGPSRGLLICSSRPSPRRPAMRSPTLSNPYCPAPWEAWEGRVRGKERARLFRPRNWSSIEKMSDKDVYRWYRPIRAPMSFESYERLPRHPSYKMEYWDGQLRISPRWRSHSFFLELQPPEGYPRVDAPRITSIRPLIAGDWDRLPEILAAAFRDAPPLGMLGYRRRVWAARDWLCSTRDGGEGALVQPACVVAADPEDDKNVMGALLVTVMDESARSWYASLRAAVDPPPPDLAEGREQSQISWIFVRPGCSCRGVGTALLAAAARTLWSSGYRELASATHFGNVPSLAWHWRNGFHLLPHPDSVRLLKPKDRDRPGA